MQTAVSGVIKLFKGKNDEIFKNIVISKNGQRDNHTDTTATRRLQ